MPGFVTQADQFRGGGDLLESKPLAWLSCWAEEWLSPLLHSAFVASVCKASISYIERVIAPFRVLAVFRMVHPVRGKQTMNSGTSVGKDSPDPWNTKWVTLQQLCALKTLSLV